MALLLLGLLITRIQRIKFKVKLTEEQMGL